MTPYEYFTKEELNSFQGFDIFEADTGYEFQKEDENDIFKDDFEAWGFIWEESQKGSALHNKIIEFIKTNNKTNYNWLSQDIISNKIKIF
jgi:hypothetical protein